MIQSALNVTPRLRNGPTGRPNRSDRLGVFKPSLILFHHYLIHPALSLSLFLRQSRAELVLPPPPPFDFLPPATMSRFLAWAPSQTLPPPSPTSSLASPRPSRRESKLQATMNSSSATHRRSTSPVVFHPNKSQNGFVLSSSSSPALSFVDSGAETPPRATAAMAWLATTGLTGCYNRSDRGPFYLFGENL